MPDPSSESENEELEQVQPSTREMLLIVLAIAFIAGGSLAAMFPQIFYLKTEAVPPVVAMINQWQREIVVRFFLGGLIAGGFTVPIAWFALWMKPPGTSGKADTKEDAK